LRTLRPLPTGRGPAARTCAGLLALFAACGRVLPAVAAPADVAAAAAAAPAPAQLVMYLARRSWHIDVGFAVRDLDPSLAFIAHRFPQAKYVFFGFGDRHYLLSKGKGPATLAGALLPGPGLILVTTIENSPVQAFGAPHVLEFALPAPRAAAAQHFVRDALAGGEGGILPVAEGPYEGSVYYGAVARYSALHTCNTWVAEALESAGFKVHTHFVVFAGQTWRQARKIEARAVARSAPAKGVLAPGSREVNRRAADCRSGTRPSWSSPAGPPPWSSAGEVGSSC
jgi:Protein of unknown function (DUF2459)